MKRFRLPELRVHEWIFGSFLLVTAGRLLASGVGSLGMAFAGMAAAVVVTAMIATYWPSLTTARLRLALFPVLVNVVYLQLGSVVERLGLAMWDEALLEADRAILGETPAIAISSWATPFYTELLSACYLLFFPAVFTAFAVAIIQSEPKGVRLFNGLISIYAVGFLGYSLLPAAGPHLAMPEAFPTPLVGGPSTRANSALVASGSNGVDVFPSLHAGITVFLMGCLWPRRRGLFFLLLLPAIGLCVATIYLRYHYAVDVGAGILLACIGLTLVRFPSKSNELDTPLS